LTEKFIQDNLKSGSLVIDMGLISARVASKAPAVIREITQLYRDYSFSKSADSWYDYSIGIKKPPTLRALIKPQAIFEFDNNTPFKPLPFAHAYPLFEWGLNWSVANHLHDYLILHAAVLEKGGKALVLPAPPGSGKSTLCAMLALSGWRLMSDEMTVIDLRSGNVIPFVRPICLKNNSITLIKNLFPDTYVSRVAIDTQKGNVAHVRPPQNAVERKCEEAQIEAIVFPKYNSNSETKLEVLTQTETFESLIENAFNFDLFGHDGFELLAGTVKHSKSYYCEYSDFADLEPKLSALVS
tara:strand:- start:1157 stop:2050 length:894 start_codon:yes stop_codon:yes gene_type:complete